MSKQSKSKKKSKDKVLAKKSYNKLKIIIPVTDTINYRN